MTTPTQASDRLETTLREVCEHLAPIDTTPCSPGEREAADWIAERLRGAGASDIRVEEEASWGTWPPNLAVLGALGVLAPTLVLRGRRLGGSALAALATAGILDEVENGPRVFRRLLRRRRTTPNVVAGVGDPTAPRTLVVLAHHDAAQTGHFYDQTLLRKAAALEGPKFRRRKTQLPQWWLGLAAQTGAWATAATGRRGPAVAGRAVGVVALLALLDILRSPTVPGANDNLSAVALLVGLAELMRDDPIAGVRVELVSAGAEETLQDGIRGYMERHRDRLDPATTFFLVPDTVGSPHLIMLEGEGPFWIEEYTDPSFRDLVARVASESGIDLDRGYHARASTDSVIPSRAGYPTACLGSLTDWQAPANYHLMTDTPENLVYGTIADATKLAYGVAEALADGPSTRRT